LNNAKFAVEESFAAVAAWAHSKVARNEGMLLSQFYASANAQQFWEQAADKQESGHRKTCIGRTGECAVADFGGTT
jgi:hypothetical protein